MAVQCRELADALETEDTILFTPGQTPMTDDRSDKTGQAYGIGKN
ncbi:MAG: hypothetical protein ACLSA6_14380 [Holdemania massiliensis]